LNRRFSFLQTSEVEPRSSIPRGCFKRCLCVSESFRLEETNQRTFMAYLPGEVIPRVFANSELSGRITMNKPDQSLERLDDLQTSHTLLEVKCLHLRQALRGILGPPTLLDLLFYPLEFPKKGLSSGNANLVANTTFPDRHCHYTCSHYIRFPNDFMGLLTD